MIEFVNPKLLYLLLLIPVFIGIFILHRVSRKRKLRKFGNPEVVSRLMPEASRYMPSVKLTVELIIFALLVLIVARPYATNEDGEGLEQTVNESGMELMVCLDVSNSMLASSTSEPDGISRMQRTRMILEKLLQRLSNDKIGLVIYAGNAYLQLPVTSDFVSAKMYLDNIDPGMVPTQGTAIGSAIDMAVNSFSPTSEFPKAIVVITDGENFEDDAKAAAADAAKQNIRVNVIGVGTTTAVPIPLGNGRYMTDYDGREVLTALNVEEAEAIAKAGKGIYISGNANDAVDKLAENLNTFTRKDYQRKFHSPSAEQFHILAWIAFILLIIDVIIVTRKISWLSRINFFSKEKK